MTFVTYACHNPQTITSPSSPIVEKVSYNASKTNELVPINFVPFGEKCLTLLTNAYDECAEQDSVVDNQIFKSIIKVRILKNLDDDIKLLFYFRRFIFHYP